MPSISQTFFWRSRCCRQQGCCLFLGVILPLRRWPQNLVGLRPVGSGVVGADARFVAHTSGGTVDVVSWCGWKTLTWCRLSFSFAFLCGADRVLCYFFSFLCLRLNPHAALRVLRALERAGRDRPQQNGHSRGGGGPGGALRGPGASGMPRENEQRHRGYVV